MGTIMVPALDYIIENPEFFEPPREKNYKWMKIVIPVEYLLRLADESFPYPSEMLEEVIRKLRELYYRPVKYLSNQTPYAFTSVKGCSDNTTTEIPSMYLPVLLCRDLGKRYNDCRDEYTLYTYRREITLIAAYYGVHWCYNESPYRKSLEATESAEERAAKERAYLLVQSYMKGTKTTREQMSLLRAKAGSSNDRRILKFDNSLGSREGLRGSAAMAIHKLCGKYAYVAIMQRDNDNERVITRYRYTEADQEWPNYFLSLYHSLPDWFLKHLPQDPWQAALSDAIICPPEDVRIVICNGPTNTGKTLTALQTLIGLLKANDAEDGQDLTDDQRRNKIVFPYRLFRAEEYAQGYEWDKGLPIAPSSPSRGLDYEPDCRTVAFTHPLIDAWNELAHLQGYEPAGLIDFLAERCEFCSLEDMRYRRITDSYIVLDNFQNYTVAEANMLLNAAWHNSKVIILGDIDQVTRPECDKMHNGLFRVMLDLVGDRSDVAYVCLTQLDRPDTVLQC